jgi:hypothetical protein
MTENRKASAQPLNEATFEGERVEGTASAITRDGNRGV